MQRKPSRWTLTRRIGISVAAIAFLTLAAIAQQPSSKPKFGYQDTPMLPGGKWHVHDGTRPQPTIVTPGTSSTQDAPGTAPSDATVLFDGKDLARWSDGKSGPARWKVEDGAIVIVPKSGSLVSKDQFSNFQLHLEFAEPTPPKGSDQGRGNSGILIFGLYEIQVLDCVDNPTYADGTVGALYGQHPPLVNASRKPGQWQVYDIIFTAPSFKPDGSVETPASATILLNGVLVQNHEAFLGSVVWRDLAKYQKNGPTKGPIVLQDHGDPVRFRNIWVREVGDDGSR